MNNLTKQEYSYLTRLLRNEIRRKTGEINNVNDQAADPRYPKVTPGYASGMSERLGRDIERAESILSKIEEPI